MYEKILVATDGSQNAKDAVEHAAELGRLAGTKEAIIVHVCTACSADLDPDESIMELAKSIVREAGETFRLAGIQTTKRVETEYPPESVGNAILEVSDAVGADLVVLGSRGLSEFKGMLLGSVSHRVVQKANCPVLVIKSDSGEEQA